MAVPIQPMWPCSQCAVALHLQGHVSTIGVNQEQDSPLVGAGALHEADEATAFPDLDTVDLVAVRCDIPSERVCQHSKSQSEARLTAGCWIIILAWLTCGSEQRTQTM